MIGLDAADLLLVDRWIADGSLANLAELKRTGSHGRLETSARYLAGSPWPTFYTGRPPSHHGIYADFQWRHETMAYARPGADWLEARPFWRFLDADRPVFVYDVPMILSCEPFPGTEISGWASHDKLGPMASHPPELLDEMRREFGEWSISPEPYGPSRIGELLALRQELLENTTRSSRLIRRMLDRPWKLAIVVFGALHRGGHRLWDRSSVRGSVSTAEGELFDRALRDLYMECDRAVGELAATAPDALVIVFSLHGMGPNSSRADLFDDMLHAILHPGEPTPRNTGLVRRFGELLPLDTRRFLTARVPRRMQNRLISLWAAGGTDWTRTEGFPLRADLQGYVRINLEGRERDGVVPSGQPYFELCDRIAEGLLTFRDGTTGEPVVESVQRIDRTLPDGPALDRLPDLVVHWPDTPAGTHESVESSRFGIVRRATPGRIPNGRSGNHRPEGFFIAAGGNVPRMTGSELRADILDLAPTVLSLLEEPVPAGFDGVPIPELAGTAPRPQM